MAIRWTLQRIAVTRNLRPPELDLEGSIEFEYTE